VPYIAFTIFIAGFITKVVSWARSPVPLKIPTTTGQARTLDFLPRTIHDKIGSPFTKKGVALRMFWEIFLMGSLFRNTRFYHDRMINIDARWLWLFAMVFHYSLLIVLIRHLRFFTYPVPDLVLTIDWVDGMAKFFVPPIYISGMLVLVALAFLWGRRIFLARERSLSLPSDHLALFLFAVILVSGTLMRYVVRIDITSVKTFALGLATFNLPPYEVLREIHWLFYIHLIFVSLLIAYIPFSKLMHFAGIFFSPTRNMPNDNRKRRHINPWNPPYVGITWNEYYENYKAQLDEIAEMGYKVKPEV
jgi:nitrate reductase gamma subunit